MQNPFIVGQKVYLRPLEREDALTLQPWINDPDITRYLKAHRPMSLRAEEHFIDRVNQSETDVVLMIVRLDVDTPIGVTGLHHIHLRNRNAHFGINIGDKHSWGMGFGSEATMLMMQYAFDNLNLHRVALHVYSYNQRAIEVYQRLGFREEGILREDNYRDGQYWDTILMGLLRSEWRELMLVSEEGTET